MRAAPRPPAMIASLPSNVILFEFVRRTLVTTVLGRRLSRDEGGAENDENDVAMCRTLIGWILASQNLGIVDLPSLFNQKSSQIASHVSGPRADQIQSS